jgi:hypothetical protein
MFAKIDKQYFFRMCPKKNGNLTKENSIQEDNMEKDQLDLISLKKEDNEETLEISSTGYGLVSVPKETDKHNIQQDNA